MCLIRFGCFSNRFSYSVISDHARVLLVEISSNLLPKPLFTSFVAVTLIEALIWLTFFDMIASCSLLDLGFDGAHAHTWVRNGLQERLDRLLVSTDWGEVLPKSIVSHLPRIHSDHAPLLLKASSIVHRVPSAFRFQNIWLRHPSFFDTIKQAWDGPTGASGMNNLSFKLIRVKQKLQWWNKNIFGNVFAKLQDAEHKVATCEQLYDSNPTPDALIHLKQAIAELTLATKIEEDYWHQKSACKWVVEGERNTKYFHNLVKQKRLQSRIHSISYNSYLLHSEDDIKKFAADFFKNHLSSDRECPAFSRNFTLPSIPC
ncbi:hypothetical protein DH2020_046500 [Rehmannia glutinosa]|uniref:RNA-directed DNA polymerase (Reverse transcriptase) n=1 Tax=Rehmannia glutinosa TaxID=99300 RepID=A0ABR0UBN8_REHGL